VLITHRSIYINISFVYDFPDVKYGKNEAIIVPVAVLPSLCEDANGKSAEL
jgi:hypothetical protein